MSRKQASLDIVKQQGVLPLYFHANTVVSIEVLKTLYNAGIRAVEYTNRGAEALENFKAMIAERDTSMPGMQLGIGTIKTAADAHAFIAAGADFLISPGFVPEVGKAIAQTDLLWVPGCMTTSEIIAAEQMGCTFVKLFPGNLIGPSYVSAIKDIFPTVSFMPTGGVEVEEGNIKAWFKSGVIAVGLGSKLISKDLLEARDYATISSLTTKAIQIIQSVRNSK